MRLTKHVYLAGSGNLGLNLTNAYDCNIYLLDAGTSLVLIDCGAGLEMEKLFQEIRRDGFDPADITHIVVTHAHADHAGGAAKLKAHTGAQVLCLPQTASILESGDEDAIHLPECRKVGMYPQDYRFHACAPVTAVHDRQQLQIGNISLEIIHTPGHSSDMISCYVAEWRALFCSDLLFAGGRIAMQVSPQFSLFALSQSVARLTSYDVELLFPGHLAPVLSEGGQLIHQVHETFKALKVPPNIV